MDAHVAAPGLLAATAALPNGGAAQVTPQLAGQPLGMLAHGAQGGVGMARPAGVPQPQQMLPMYPASMVGAGVMQPQQAQLHMGVPQMGAPVQPATALLHAPPGPSAALAPAMAPAMAMHSHPAGLHPVLGDATSAASVPPASTGYTSGRASLLRMMIGSAQPWHEEVTPSERAAVRTEIEAALRQLINPPNLGALSKLAAQMDEILLHNAGNKQMYLHLDDVPQRVTAVAQTLKHRAALVNSAAGGTIGLAPSSTMEPPSAAMLPAAGLYSMPMPLAPTTTLPMPFSATLPLAADASAAATTANMSMFQPSMHRSASALLAAPPAMSARRLVRVDDINPMLVGGPALPQGNLGLPMRTGEADPPLPPPATYCGARSLSSARARSRISARRGAAQHGRC